MTSTSKPTLGYWAIRGLASQIRYQMVYQGIDFNEDIYEQGDAPDYSRDSWTNAKHSLGLEFPNLPYLIHEDVKITETQAIMKYLANQFDPKLLGTTPEQIG